MSYRKDLDEYDEEHLQGELDRRESLRAEGKCDYCGRHSTESPCKFPERHRLGTPPGEVCKRCFTRNTIGFRVHPDIWEKVAGDKYSIMCPACFDEEAQNLGVEYTFLQLFPATWCQSQHYGGSD